MAIGTPLDLGHFASSATPTSGTITTGNAVTAGGIIVILRYANQTTGTFTSAPTDSSGNTYVQAPAAARVSSVAPVCDVWYCANAAAMASSSAISFNFSGSALRESVDAFTCTGLATSNPIDPGSVGTANGTTGTAASATSMNVNVYYNSMLLIGAVTSGSNYSALVPGGNWTALGGVSNAGANITPAYQIVSTPNVPVAWAPSWTTSVLYRSFGFAIIGSGATFEGPSTGATQMLMGVG